MAANEEQDKSEAATPFKLDEARRQGQVFRSAEMISLAMLGAALALALAGSMTALSGVMDLFGRLLIEAGRFQLVPFNALGLLAWLSERALLLLAPWALVLLLVGILSNLLQTGPVFSGHPLKPDFSRLNPAKGFKRVFSMRSLYEGLKAILKFAVLGFITYLVIKGLLEQLPQISGITPKRLVSYLHDQAALMVFLLLLGFAALGLADFAYSRWEFMKLMRMSRRELKDEFKRREGDPQVRNKRRELQRALRKRSAGVARVGDADLLITNPTHIAIALQYHRGKMPAPKLIAKASGELALRMREEAFRRGVPVFEVPELARALFREVDIEDAIPEGLFPQVAAVFRKLYERMKQAEARA